MCDDEPPSQTALILSLQTHSENKIKVKDPFLASSKNKHVLKQEEQ